MAGKGGVYGLALYYTYLVDIVVFPRFQLGVYCQDRILFVEHSNSDDVRCCALKTIWMEKRKTF